MLGCRPLDDDEIPKLLAALAATQTGTRDQTLAVLGITTGFRISELLSLLIRDLTTRGRPNSHVRIPASRMKGKKHPRSAPLSVTVHPYLNAWLLELRHRGLYAASRPLFIGPNICAPITRVQAHRILHAAYARAGFVGGPRELACHTLRKTYAAKMWDQHDKNIWKLQHALGHASPASTLAYLSFDDAEQTTAVENAFAPLFPARVGIPATLSHTPPHN